MHGMSFANPQVDDMILHTAGQIHMHYKIRQRNDSKFPTCAVTRVEPGAQWDQKSGSPPKEKLVM